MWLQVCEVSKHRSQQRERERKRWAELCWVSGVAQRMPESCWSSYSLNHSSQRKPDLGRSTGQQESRGMRNTWVPRVPEAPQPRLLYIESLSHHLSGKPQSFRMICSTPSLRVTVPWHLTPEVQPGAGQGPAGPERWVNCAYLGCKSIALQEPGGALAVMWASDQEPWAPIPHLLNSKAAAT